MNLLTGAFWTRAKVGTATGVLGLALGAGLGAAGQAPIDARTPEVKALVTAAIAKKTAPLEDENAQLREDLATAKTEADAASSDAERELVKAQEAAAKAQAKAVRKAVKAERVKAAKAVREAKAAVPKPAPKTYGIAGNTGGAPAAPASSGDPLFDTCGAANAAGYGDYRQGVDPEYDHYQDRDHDGWVCER